MASSIGVWVRLLSSRIMSHHVADFFKSIRPDPWRADVGFAPEVQAANAALFSLTASDTGASEAILSNWLQKHQPCLFGRIAAKYGLLTYCVLSEKDLLSSDEHVQERIQEARTSWTHDAFEGRKSGFVISIISERLAGAIPDAAVGELARRIASLYLEDEILFDRIYLDQVWLEKPGYDRATWAWPVGVNYFSSHGDQRWWNDHRFPGGLAFSMNSVGHMVKSGLVSQSTHELSELFDLSEQDWKPPKVDSLPLALEFAMRTIAKASMAVSGPATTLLPAPADASLPACPTILPSFLSGKNHCEYSGYYHTDYTLPSEYFRAEAARPDDVKQHQLDFTYLFDDRPENPDFKKVGVGRKVRLGPSRGDLEVLSRSDDLEVAARLSHARRYLSGHDGDFRSIKRLATAELSGAIEDYPRLVRALSGDS